LPRNARMSNTVPIELQHLIQNALKTTPTEATNTAQQTNLKHRASQQMQSYLRVLNQRLDKCVVSASNENIDYAIMQRMQALQTVVEGQRHCTGGMGASKTVVCQKKKQKQTPDEDQ
jgi:glycyl-tRNA synthetase beta subunit